MSRVPSELLAARYQNDHEKVASLLAGGVELDVFDAAAMGDDGRIAELLDGGADLNAFADDGFTPLQLAAFFGQPHAVALLLSRGADVDAVARNDMKIHALHAAAASGNLESIELLLDAGADVNAQQHGGYTALDEARVKEDAAMEAMLLAAGATVTAGAPATGE
jgi:uncharacterized protein